MRYVKTILSSLALLLVSSATAMAMVLQDPPIKVNVETNEGSTTWYTSPQWLAIIGLAVLLIIVAIVAARKRGSSTTVIR
jgi:hypothetical protein